MENCGVLPVYICKGLRAEVVMKKYAWLEKYCTDKKGAIKDYQEKWEAFRYLVGGKMFVMHGGDKFDKEIITLKLKPENGEYYREKYEGVVVPGYYMNKVHWNSVYVDGDVPDEVLKKMIDESYELIVGALPKKMQSELLAGS